MREVKIIKVDKRGDTSPAVEERSCCASGACDRTDVPLRIGESKESRADDHDNAPEWVCGTVKTPGETVFKVSTELSFYDHWGRIKSRMSAFRMKYGVAPGLYAVGEPDNESDVFVSANYKLSFDKVRQSLKGMNAWIVVLDTKGINVWCAAGKGTFGTEELIRRISSVQLDKVVTHKRIIVPQLGAPGVNAKAVKQGTGFRVYFGPVYAGDIPAYVNAGYKATREMRTVRFTLADRLALTPLEINPVMKSFPLYAVIVLLLFGVQPSGILYKDAFLGGMPFLLLGLIAVFAGAFLTPALLPFIPFRSFAIKGWIVGMLTVALSVRYFGVVDQDNVLLTGMTYLFFPAAASYIALQFTGSTTYTGISGVKRELRIAIPVYITSLIIAVLLTITYKLEQWGVV